MIACDPFGGIQHLSDNCDTCWVSSRSSLHSESSVVFSKWFFQSWYVFCYSYRDCMNVVLFYCLIYTYKYMSVLLLSQNCWYCNIVRECIWCIVVTFPLMSSRIFGLSLQFVCHYWRRMFRQTFMDIFHFSDLCSFRYFCIFHFFVIIKLACFAKVYVG